MDSIKQNKIDHLINKASHAEGDDQITFLLELSSSLLQDNALEALNYAASAKEVAERLGKQELLASIHMHIGNAYKFIGEYPKAILTLQKSIQLALELNQKQEYANALKDLGIVYKNVGEYGKSLECYLDCLRANRELRTTQNEGAILSNIGNLYRLLKNYDKAIEYHLQALELYDPAEPKSIKAGRLINIGVSFYEKSDFEEALEYYRRALAITRKKGPELYSALSMANIGLIHLESGDFKQSLKILNQALLIFEEIQNSSGMQNALLDISKVYKAQKDFTKAIEYIDQSLLIAKKLQTKERLKNCYKEYYEVYESKQDYKKALEYHKLFSEIKDSIVDQKKTRQIAELETKSALEKLEMKNDLINNRNEELKSINEELEQFAYAASHDLKEPLRMIKSYTMLLERKAGDKLEGDSKQFMHFITDGVDRMEKLLTDLLEYSRIGREQLEFEMVDLNEIIQGVERNLSATIEEKNATIIYSNLSTVKAYDSQMTQLFQNLISNGIKFNRTGNPHIEINAVDKATYTTISIKDNGIGIDEKYKDRVFQIFKRLNRRDEFDGTGIGLSTCRKIVERHGGQIWFESVEGEGTTFYFNLPKSAA